MMELNENHLHVTLWPRDYRVDLIRGNIAVAVSVGYFLKSQIGVVMLEKNDVSFLKELIRNGRVVSAHNFIMAKSEYYDRCE